MWRGKSRSQLAGLMGCSAESVKAIEVGRRELTLTMAVRAARALGLRDLAALYGPDVSYYTPWLSFQLMRRCPRCAVLC